MNRFCMDATQFPGPRDCAELYPGVRPPGDFLLSHRNGVPTVFSIHGSLADLDQAIVNDGSGRHLGRFLTDRGKAPPSNRVAMLAYGSNACPMQAYAKFRELTGADGLPNIDVVAIRGITRGFASVFMATTAAPTYASVPAMLAPSDATSFSETWLLLVECGEQLWRLNDSELVRPPDPLYEIGLAPFERDGLTLDAYTYFARQSSKEATGTKAYVAEDGELRRFASTQDVPHLEPGIDYVPIDCQGSSLKFQTESQLMQEIGGLFQRRFGYALYQSNAVSAGRSSSVLTNAARANHKELNAWLAGEFGKVVQRSNASVIEDPYNSHSFKTLAELL